MIADQIRFLGRLIARPSQVGAVAPSSPALARAMAAQIDPSWSGQILELGPGTGVVTAALIARGIAPERIVSIEYDPDFAKLVAQRFPGVRVVPGDAYDLRATLGDTLRAPFAAIVSSLPLLNEAPARRQNLIETAFDLIAPAAPFVQFSYGLHSPVPPSGTVAVTRAALVLLNLPPARVWVYRRKTT
ncbi:MAG: rRNA adenine N-6-methyltransferase family protein [Rhizomicrobium sp.]|jgi:phosphatidylethanolamine/phosphatidyl-N-methylethanolamine N-methyltransferase